MWVTPSCSKGGLCAIEVGRMNILIIFVILCAYVRRIKCIGSSVNRTEALVGNLVNQNSGCGPSLKGECTLSYHI